MIGNLKSTVLGVFTPEPRVVIPTRLLARTVGEVYPGKTNLTCDEIRLALYRTRDVLYKTPNIHLYWHAAGAMHHFSTEVAHNMGEPYVRIPQRAWEKLIAHNDDYRKMAQAYADAEDDPVYAGLQIDRPVQVTRSFAQRLSVLAQHVQYPAPAPAWEPAPAPFLARGLDTFPA